MRYQMFIQIRRVVKFGCALRALVRLLAAVDQIVDFERFFAAKRLATLLADVGPGRGVEEFVPVQLAAQREGLAARSARVRLRSHVDERVDLQVGLAYELFAADVAPVRFAT